MQTDLRTYLTLLECEKEVIFIDAEVNPHLEAAEVHRPLVSQGGDGAVLFGL